MNQVKIGKFIQERRKELHLTQSELAEKLDVTDKSVSNWENGKNMPDISLIKPLCEILDITSGELLDGKKDEKNKKVFHHKVHKKKKIFFLCIALLIILVLGMILLFRKESNEDKLNKALRKLDATNKILITDTYKENGEVTFTVKDKNEIEKIVHILKKIQISKAGYSETYRYRIQLLDKDSNILLEFKYWPLKLKGIDVFLEETTNDSLYHHLTSKYTISFRDSIKDVSNDLKRVKRLVIKNYNTGKFIKDIKDENKIYKFINLILDSKIWEGAINLPSQYYDIDLYDTNNNLIGNVVFNPYLSITLNDIHYQLTGFDKESLLKIITE